MNKTTEFGLCVLGGALVLGIMADTLLSPMVPGVNVVLCVLTLAGVVGTLARWQRVAVTGERAPIAATHSCHPVRGAVRRHRRRRRSPHW